MILDTKQVQQLEKFSQSESLSISWLIRRAIQHWLETISELPARGSLSRPTRLPRKKDPLLSVIGLYHAGGMSNSEIDEEIYDR